MIDYQTLCRRAVARLKSAGIAQPDRDVSALLDHAAGGRSLRHDPISPEVAAQFEALLQRRENRQPVSQIIGRRAFWNAEFAVTPAVLDPRPETEVLIEHALARDFRTVLDLGTGSGCILLTLLSEAPGSLGHGTDISPDALDVARQNAVRLGCQERAVFTRSDWYSAVTGQFDLIVSNPPYIALAEMAGLAPEVRDHEPHIALTDGGDGLAAYRAIAAGVRDHLIPGGRILLEIGPTQGAAVSALLAAAGLKDIQIHPDWDGRDRVVRANAPK